MGGECAVFIAGAVAAVSEEEAHGPPSPPIVVAPVAAVPAWWPRTGLAQGAIAVAISARVRARRCGARRCAHAGAPRFGAVARIPIAGGPRGARARSWAVLRRRRGGD